MVRAAITDPLTMIASDGMLITGKGHPRTQARTRASSGNMCAGKSTVADGCAAQDDVDARAKAGETCTGLPRQRPDSHWSRCGYYRIRSDKVIDKATYEEPLQYSEGIHFVFVNGTLVVKDGKLVEGVFPGRCCTGAYRACEVALENSSASLAAAVVQSGRVRTWRDVGSHEAKTHSIEDAARRRGPARKTFVFC